MLDPSSGMSLITIRRQPMIFRADESFEKGPSLSGKLTEEEGLVNRKPGSGASERPADPPCNRGGSKPKAQYGPSYAYRGRPRKR